MEERTLQEVAVKEGNRVDKQSEKPLATLHDVSRNKILHNLIEKQATEVIFTNVLCVFEKICTSVWIVAFYIILVEQAY